MDINIRFQVANESLTSEQQAEARQVVIDALESYAQANQFSTFRKDRVDAIINALLDEDQLGTLPE